MKPELSMNPNVEVLYEELPQQRYHSTSSADDGGGGGGGGGGVVAGEVIYAMAPKRNISAEDLYATVDTALSEPTYSTVDRGAATGAAADDGEHSVVYAS